jgi:tRNA A-37 threonylcarbamoyl transferase component Bud32
MMSLGKLGKYSLLERLGEGGMGEVYRAATEGPSGFRRELAIKQMRQSLSTDERLKELFLAEARALAELRHRNIVQVFEFDVAQGRPYLVMELLHGVSLSQFLKAPLPIEGVCFVGAELADALSAVHKSGRANGQGGMVHGDLSPSNVMACEDGAVKLLDFGLATHEQSNQTSGPRAGKLPYLAPELLAGAPLDALTDVYAVGVTLYELICGARLFPSGSPQEIASKIARADYPKLAAVRPEIPDEVREQIERCLSRERSDRPQSASQLAKALHRCHARFGAAELARFVRQAQGGPSIHEPTGTLPRREIDQVIARGELATHGPQTASALPEKLGVPSAPLPALVPERRWPILLAMIGLLALGAAVPLIWFRQGPPLPAAPLVQPAVAAPILPAEATVTVLPTEPVAPEAPEVRSSDSNEPTSPSTKAKRPGKKKISRPARAVTTARPPEPPQEPDRLSPGLIVPIGR